jgi:thymidylate synthase
MNQYLDLVNNIQKNGTLKENRTGTSALTIAGAIFEHEMSKGFPLLTTKKMAHKSIRVELEGFINGVTDKKWYQDRKCHIWDEWCNPQKVPYSHDEETKSKMREERDLGPIYGFQWRHFGADYISYNSDYTDKGVDQLKNLISQLKENPNDRRMIVSAWNPKQLYKMALPPCHYNYQAIVTGKKLNLVWGQRSIDAMLGLPFNIASYGLLLHLLAKESEMLEGKLVGFLGDLHIYTNHIDNAKKQTERKPFKLPNLETTNFKNIFEWTHNDSKVTNYKHHEKINFPIAI